MGRGTARSAVEGLSAVSAPPPCFAWSPSPSPAATGRTDTFRSTSPGTETLNRIGGWVERSGASQQQGSSQLRRGGSGLDAEAALPRAPEEARRVGREAVDRP